jgi:hypothetical protein
MGLLSLEVMLVGTHASGHAIAETNQPRRDPSGLNRQHADAARQREPPRAGGPWIKQDRTAMPADHGAMTVAEDADVRLFAVQPGLRLRGHLPFVIQDMTECDFQARASKEAPPRKPAGFIVVHIAGDRRDRRKSLQTADHILAADIPCVQNFLRRDKIPRDGRIVQSVRIGDHADLHALAPDQCTAALAAS